MGIKRRTQENKVEMLHSVSDLRPLFNELFVCRDRVVETIAAEALPMWFPEDYSPSREDAARALTILWFDDAKHILPYGLLCVSAETAAIIAEFNQAKLRFEAHIDWFRATFNATLACRSRAAALSKHLSSVGLGRLNLISCFQNVCILGDGVRRVGWVFCKSIKAITPRSAEEAYAMTDQLFDDLAEQARSSIGVQRGSTEFRIITNVAPHWRANVRYASESAYTRGEIVKAMQGVEKFNSNPTRRMVNAGLPLVCVGNTLPRIRPPRKIVGVEKTRTSRSDKRKMQLLVQKMNLYCFEPGKEHE